MQATFISHLISHLSAQFNFPLEHQILVLPSKRAKIFILKELALITKTPFFAPQIITLDDLVTSITQLKKLDTISLFFEFYSVYRKLKPSNDLHSIDVFSSWAYKLLADFSDMDSYLLSPSELFSYLEAAESLKRWKVDISDSTPIMNQQLEFWSILPDFYFALTEHLLAFNCGYHGLIYRQASSLASDFINTSPNHFFFVGFNALTPAEKSIIESFLKSGKAHVFWDIDEHFLSHNQHEAAYFIQKHRNWTHFNSYPFEWTFANFKSYKSIEIIGTPKQVGQAKVCAEILDKWFSVDSNLSTAVILGDESLLIPVLQQLPSSIDAVNITMSYPAHHNSFITTINHLIFAQVKAKQKSNSSPVYYYKDLWSIFQDPNISLVFDSTALQKFIAQQNYTYVTYETLYRFSNQNSWVQRFFKPWPDDMSLVLNILLDILLAFRDELNASKDKYLISLSFVYAAYQNLQQTSTYIQKYSLSFSLDFLLKLWRQMARNSKVSFEGQPLQGLQIMGLLESRVLDFDRVIILSVNEGVLPSGKSNESFIPYDIRRELGLPTYKEKDALFAYYFYHALQRAKEVCLVYDTDSEGVQAKEPSRYIWQLEADPINFGRLNRKILSPQIPFVSHKPIQIPKSNLLSQKLIHLGQKGFSPSSLLQYIRDPYTFYLRKVLEMQEQEEVEESIAVNTLGTVMHKVLEELYKPFLNVPLNISHFAQMKRKLMPELQAAFSEIYKAGGMSQGKNKLSYEVAKATLERYLNEEETACTTDEIVVLALEQTFKRVLHHPDLPCEILLKGNFDRIERRNGQLTIVDYKTGKVEQKQLNLSEMSDLELTMDFEKVFQLLTYAWLYGGDSTEIPVVGIRSFKNNKAGFMSLQVGGNALLNVEQIQHFEDLLVQLLKEIYNPEIPFTQKLD